MTNSRIINHHINTQTQIQIYTHMLQKYGYQFSNPHYFNTSVCVCTHAQCIRMQMQLKDFASLEVVLCVCEHMGNDRKYLDR